MVMVSIFAIPVASSGIGTTAPVPPHSHALPCRQPRTPALMLTPTHPVANPAREEVHRDQSP
ncbi:hypothetical protein DDJ31_04805 [Streptomyces griseoviridis]|uniref:Uncharacterized protein n=1 Tax=Streptomyces griseoviridis TaxID=45398 RepID=A0A6G5SAN5_STRGD|nr:hypothetical protein DDJ31_04805 [Streptomyces griseoviridis]